MLKNVNIVENLRLIELNSNSKKQAIDFLLNNIN